MKNNNNILRTLRRYADGTCTLQEEGHVRKWLYENIADSKYDSVFEEFLETCRQDGDSERVKLAYERLEARITAIAGSSRKRNMKGRILTGLRVSFAAALIAVVITLFTERRKSEKVQEPVIAETSMQTFSVPAGSTAVMRLSDGTVINVNAMTTVIYPKNFSEEERRVRVEGEAYFDVMYDPERPFIVETDYFDVKVHGTEFNVNTFCHNESANVVLVDGSVEVSDDSESFFIEPGMMAFAGRDGLVAKNVDVDDYVSWKEGYLMLNGMTMNQIAEKLSSYYGIGVSFEGKSSHLYGKLDLKGNFLEMTENINRIIPINVTKTEKGYRITTINQ